MKLRLTVEKAREQVAKLGKKMATNQLVLGTWGNVSCRLPRENVVVITPSGIPYENLRPHMTVVLNMQGGIEEGDLKPSSEATVHLAIYAARPDVGAVVHTHSPYASALAVAQVSIPPILEDMAALIGGEVAVAQYAIAGSKQLATNTVQALGTKNAVLLANHGVVAVGRNLDEAFDTSMMVERCAHIYLAAKQMGEPGTLSVADVKKMRDFYLTQYSK